MRKVLIYITVFTFFLALGACKDFLNLEPLNKVSKDYLFATPAGVKTLLATLYNRVPMEDFTYRPGGGFNDRPAVAGAGDGGYSLSANSDEAVIWGPNGYTSQPANTVGMDWGATFTSLRYVNQFMVDVKALNKKGQIDDASFNQFMAEAHYMRATMYFALAKRFGGLPIITYPQDLYAQSSALLIPRSTENDTYRFIMFECDSAIAGLPVNRVAGASNRATKWVAYALKSRAALHAASLAKFWNKAPLSGPAVDAKLIGGMTTADADFFYGECISASRAIMDNTAFALYKLGATTPTPAEAAKNYQDMFESASYANQEIIYLKNYVDGTSLSGQGHITDFWFYPKQLCYQSLYMSSRFGTTLDIVDAFEDYTDNNVGLSAPIKTRVDGNEAYTVADPKALLTIPYALISYNTQLEPFLNKDARLTASVLLPGSMFKGTVMNMQGGMIRADGKPIIYTDNSSVGPDGKTYYTYGTTNASAYSAFGGLGTAQANYSSTGFALRKYLQESKAVTNLGTYGSTQPWVEFRLAEIYLNYAEAVAESGQGDAALAVSKLNAIRKRAGHSDNIPLTVANVLKERRVEMVFENTRYWDLMRRRDMNTTFSSTRRKSLIPLIDLRQNPPKYVFLRVNNYYDHSNNGITFQPNSYYQQISGTATNLLIQNP